MGTKVAKKKEAKGPELQNLPNAAWIVECQKSLVAWYRKHKRDLPWRRRRDAYSIWVSELMLQQTRVETVIPYYERFLNRFPDVRALAAAREDEVLALWSGLGYYSRARSLLRAAQEICERHGGEFPRERNAVRALSGIGPYTAGAVLSIAFGASEALVDGNVARVFARLFGLRAPLRSKALETSLWRLAETLVPSQGKASSKGNRRGNKSLDPGEWNQAVMELGARVCLPKKPKCDACPLASMCAAREADCANELPVPAPKPELLDVDLEMLYVEKKERLLLVQRPPKGRMASMWELPTRELGSSLLWSEDFPVVIESAGAEFGLLKHSITRHRIQAALRVGAFGAKALQSPRGSETAWRFVAPPELSELGLTGLTKKALRFVLRDVGES